MRRFKRLLFLGCTLASLLFIHTGLTASIQEKFLNAKNYQKIILKHKHKPFILIIWSIDCPSCLEEMQLISEFHERFPELKMIMLATDPPSASEQIKMYLEQYQLTDIENFQIDENDVQLRQIIDKNWHGEVPRSYFFNALGARKSVSGLINLVDFDRLVQEIRQH